MSRNDYISKLFIKNQDKLEQVPSDDLWARLERQLDVDLPLEAPTTAPAPKGTGRVISMTRYAAAASVLVATIAVAYFLNNPPVPESTEIVMEEPLALLTEPVVEEAELYEDELALPANTDIADKQEEEAEKAQEEKIVEAVAKAIQKDPVLTQRNDKIELNDIELVDEKVQKVQADVVVAEPTAVETISQEEEEEVTKEADLYIDNELVGNNKDDLNYTRAYVPQISNNTNNSNAVDEVINQYQTQQNNLRVESPTIQSATAAGAPRRKRSTNRGQIFNKKGKRPEKIKSPMADAHPRLRSFGFLLGTWTDDNELEGKSYEKWNLKDANTLVGKGYKLSRNNEQVFEETMRIEFHDRQVFLVVSLDDNTPATHYMLTGFDNERYIFEQNSDNDKPNRIIIQQSGLDGFTVIMLNQGHFLSAEQQQYLGNRNHVSNVRAKRTMRLVD